MKIRKAFGLGLTLGLMGGVLTGCGNPALTMSRAELRAADYGRYPSNYRRIITSYIPTDDRDVSRVLRVTTLREPFKQYSYNFGSGAHFGWMTCVATDLRLKDGSTTYGLRHVFLIRNGSVIGHIAEDRTPWLGQMGSQMVVGYCQKEPSG